MKTKNFPEKYPTICCIVTVLCFFGIFTLVGAGAGRFTIGYKEPTNEQKLQYESIARDAWKYGIRGVRLNGKKVETVSENEIKVTDEEGLGITVDFSKNQEVITALHVKNGTKNGAVFGFSVGALLFCLLGAYALSTS